MRKHDGRLTPHRLASSGRQAPAIVRRFVVNTLHDIYHATKESATDIAFNWKYGSGAALTLFDIQRFREIFGPEAGALVYYYIACHTKSPPGSATAVNEPQQNEAVARKDLFGLRPGGRCLFDAATVILRC